MTKLVGILNVTPDSFSDGNKFNRPDKACARITQLLADGADIIDIGAESTRPGAIPLTADEEWARLYPLIEKLKEIYVPAQFSVDTRHAFVAGMVASQWSPDVMINDVSGLADPAMGKTVAAYGMRVVIGHLPVQANGNISAAHQVSMTEEQQVKDQLLKRYSAAQIAGISAANIVLDPNLGFGKSRELNIKLLGFAALVNKIPVMIGYSRKRFLGVDRLDDRVNVRAGEIAMAAGAAYLRVHDVAAHRAAVDLKNKTLYT